MVGTLASLIIGWILLWKGGDLLVEGADRFARSHGVPPTLAGVFILGFGTSLPELAASVFAVLDDKPGIAVGNVVGSNIANIALVLGASAAVAAIPVNRFLLNVEIPVAIAASLLAYALASDGVIEASDGFILLGGFAAYAAFALLTFSRRDANLGEPPPKRPWFDLGQAAFAMAAVVAGAKLFIAGASDMAEVLGVSDTEIGLTLVALGTSLPELATCVAAVRARKGDLALGNIVGSNIFNLLMVLGVAGAMQSQTLEARVLHFDIPFMLTLGLFPWICGRMGGRVPRWFGPLLVGAYVIYLTVFPKLL